MEIIPDLFLDTDVSLCILRTEAFQHSADMGDHFRTDPVDLLSSGFCENDDDLSVVIPIRVSLDQLFSLHMVQKAGNPCRADYHFLTQFFWMNDFFVGSQIVQNKQLTLHHLGKLLVCRNLQQICPDTKQLIGLCSLIHIASSLFLILFVIIEAEKTDVNHILSSFSHTIALP